MLLQFSTISFAVETLMRHSVFMCISIGRRKNEARGGVVVKALCYKPAGGGFDSRWCHWNFSVT